MQSCNRETLLQGTSWRIAPTNLRCEYLNSPLGIDVKQPRLSWKLKAANEEERGQHQSSYRILVADSEMMLAQNKGSLWDSGEVKSDQSQLVIYNGSPLSSDMRCYWKVQVRDELGILSPWSEPAHWTMGILDTSAWTAKWIGTNQKFTEIRKVPPEGNYLADPWLRKVIDLEEKPQWAVIHIASVGYHELYVNGKKVTEAVLMPSVTDHTKRARYVTYNITDYLKVGRNAIGFWLGTSWSIFAEYKTDDKPQSPVVIAQASIELPGGKTQSLITDETWKSRSSPNVLLGGWKFMNYGGEYYDAGKELPDWCSPELDDSDWEQVTVFSPKLILSAEMVEANRCVQKIEPIAIQEVKGQGYRVDMGVNCAGFVEVDVKGKPGDIIELQFSEIERTLMTHQLHSAYRIGSSGQGTFRNHFNYSSGRWILIKGLSYKPSLDDIRGYLVRTDYERAGWFESSDKLLNDIYNTTLWTFENLSLGGYIVDCPQRERMGYGGDAHATTQTGMNNYNLGAFYTKWSQDWRDVQTKENISQGMAGDNVPKEAGNLPHTAPTYWGGGGPIWSGFCITLPWYIYQYYGDKRILEENFLTIQKWLEFLETKSQNDMLVRWGGDWDFLGDWLWPGAMGVNSRTRETLFFNNYCWIYNLQTAVKIANAIDKQDIAEQYKNRADTVCKAVHKEFFNAEENGYVNNLQAYLAIALLAGLPPEQLRPAVWKRFEDEILINRKGHFWGGITGGYFIIKNLLEFDRSDLMLEMARKEDYPGWGDMLRKGATTFWEGWDGQGSLLHSSYLYIGAWFIEGLAGIRPGPDGMGYKHFIIKPAVPANKSVDWVTARFESAYGTIRSQWQIQNGMIKFDVTIPPNTTAILYLPVTGPKSIKEGNNPLTEVRGVKYLREEKKCSVLEVQSGRYIFETPL
ncbi:MAG: family 78 glycoside hydrolase catalytic domain [Sedimentisphaerales bacterium]|nr:family 78 glycoside hydrolase catalytic domain [Sedimentisphaerales bacterium]